MLCLQVEITSSQSKTQVRFQDILIGKLTKDRRDLLVRFETTVSASGT